MANVFTLFGEIKADTKAFEKSLYDSNQRLIETEKALNKVVDKSINLGDVSATVGRRYEKLNEQIAAQKTRLLDAAVAYEKGDIKAQKYAQTVISVGKATDGLTSRIKDAAARARELDETGLTHFQNQIKGATSAVQDNVNAMLKAKQATSTGSFQNNSLYGSLSVHQKTNLAYQINDVISGLAMGQDPLRILAQQGGQFVQIFQQGKTATEGMATASKAVAMAQGEGSVASKATAVAMGEASGAATIFGASIVGIGAALAAGLVVILAAKKASEDILKAAQDRLKLEEAITAQFNKQNMAVADLKKRLADEAGGRRFDQLLQSDNLPGLQQTRNDIQRTVTENLKAIADEQATRQEVVRRAGTSGPAALSYLKGADETEAQAKLRKQQEDQISTLTARIDELRQPKETGIEWYTRILQQQKDALQKSTVEASKVQREVIEQQIKEETAAFQNKFKVQEAALKLHLQVTAASQAESIVATTALQTREIDAQIANTRRHYNAIIATAKDATEAQQAESNKRIAIANLEAQKQIAAIEKVRQLAAEDAQRFGKSISAYNLRSDAARFARGFNESPQLRALQEDLARQPNLENANSAARAYRKYLEERIAEQPKLDVQRRLQEQLSALRGPIRNDADRQALNQKIIELTQGLDPAQLTSGQNAIAAQARRQEADRIEKERDKTTKELIKAIQEGALIHIINQAPDSARVTRRPRSADVADRVGN